MPDEGATLVGVNAESMVARLVSRPATRTALLACYVRGLIEARRLRIEHDREFYRNLKAYCRANSLSPVCEDDWKTSA